jgi:hypothetical protein
MIKQAGYSKRKKKDIKQEGLCVIHGNKQCIAEAILIPEASLVRG